jgi:hypothetical protein
MIVAADGDQEEYHLYVVEDVNPLLSLRSLSTDVEHAVRQRTSLEDGLADSGRS